MPTTFLFGILTFVLILGPLIILHELGHLIVARRLGVKTLEFGIGFPPRAFAVRWTGRTVVRLSPDTKFKFDDDRTHARPGDTVAALTVRNSDGATYAHTIRPVRNADESARAEGAQLIIGKVKEISTNEIVIADMLWSINWLPIGGFVRMLGEEDPAAEGSLASKGPWQRISVMSAGAAVNAVLPFLIFPVVLLIPQSQVAGDVIITRVMPGSPADGAGLKDGDKIVKVDGREIDQVGDLQQAVTLKLGAVSTWEVQRGIPGPVSPARRASIPIYRRDREHRSRAALAATSSGSRGVGNGPRDAANAARSPAVQPVVGVGERSHRCGRRNGPHR